MISRFFFHVKFSFFHTVWNITLEFRPLLASFSPTTVNMWSQFSHLTNRFALMYWLMSTRIGCPHFGQVLWLSETRKKLREINSDEHGNVRMGFFESNQSCNFTQFGNVRSFLSLQIYVKSILGIIGIEKMPFSTILILLFSSPQKWHKLIKSSFRAFKNVK